MALDKGSWICILPQSSADPLQYRNCGCVTSGCVLTTSTRTFLKVFVRISCHFISALTLRAQNSLTITHLRVSSTSIPTVVCIFGSAKTTVGDEEEYDRSSARVLGRQALNEHDGACGSDSEDSETLVVLLCCTPK